ncbi:MAG: tetratricopeptide repeat protein [Bryobacteraceae bacterium]
MLKYLGSSFLLTGILALGLAAAPAPQQGQLDGSLSLFTVMAAIHAAGYDAELDSPSNSPLRAEVRNQLAARNIPCLPELKRFVRDHHKDDPVAELSQYISLGLLVDGPPKFNYRLRQNELPSDVAALAGFETLLARFYQEAGVEDLWRKAQPEIDSWIERYHLPVTQAVLQVSGYLRAQTSGLEGFRFQIYVEPLAPPNQVHTRSYGREYFVVVTPSAEPRVDDIRHAYLHYMLDPLATRHADEILKRKALGDYALGAPFLEDFYKEDFLLLAGECLIKAVESRLATGAQKKRELVQEALSQGFILTPHFAEQLALYEKQDQSLRLYYPNLITSIDLRREEARLEPVEFAQQRPVRKATPAPAKPKPEPSAAEKTLQQAEDLYAAKDYTRARQYYLRVIQETQEAPLRGRAYYGLGRIAALEKQPELAETLFQQALKSSPDVSTAAWAHVYLGRLADLAGERDQAAAHYKAVLGLSGAPNGARQAAEEGLRKGFKKE